MDSLHQKSKVSAGGLKRQKNYIVDEKISFFYTVRLNRFIRRANLNFAASIKYIHSITYIDGPI